MQHKNYYKTLLVPLTATQPEIKKAYRQLAMKYHPDKNGGDELAAAHFKEIQEAYHVLSDPLRRSGYNQQRWYKQSFRDQPVAEVTPETLLVKCHKLSRYVATLDPARINEAPLYHYMMQLLTDESMRVLLKEQRSALNYQVIESIIASAKALSYEHTRSIGEQLMRLAGNDVQQVAIIQAFIKEQRLTGYWQRYQIVVILLITLLICWIIFAISN